MDIKEDRSVEIEWMPFSLALKNEENLNNEEERHVGTHKLLRVAAHLHQNDPSKLEDFYTSTGKQIHLEEAGDMQAIALKTLEELGLNSDLVRLLDDVSMDPIITDSMNTALDVVGDDVGTPVILFENQEGSWNGFFGPVINQLPEHEEALKLWDGLSSLATNSSFYELKRTRESGPQLETTSRLFSN